jgi:hypothetical protein
VNVARFVVANPPFKDVAAATNFAHEDKMISESALQNNFAPHRLRGSQVQRKHWPAHHFSVVEFPPLEIRNLKLCRLRRSGVLVMVPSARWKTCRIEHNFYSLPRAQSRQAR